jgi:hypothetical protein
MWKLIYVGGRGKAATAGKQANSNHDNHNINNTVFIINHHIVAVTNSSGGDVGGRGTGGMLMVRAQAAHRALGTENQFNIPDIGVRG